MMDSDLASIRPPLKLLTLRVPAIQSAFWLLLLPAAFLSIRIVYAPFMELFNDEAYYWVWSRNPALSYFDHPPMVAWLIRLSTTLFGQGELAVRLPGILLSTASMGLATLIAGRLGATRQMQFFLQGILLCFPMLHVQAAIIAPDNPAQCFILASLLTAVHLHQKPGSFLWAALLGISAGLAMLSKYTSLIPVATLLIALPVAHPRQWPAAIFAGAIATLLLFPVLLWNYQHEFVSFIFQLSHGTTANTRPMLTNLGDYIAAQGLIATPLLMPLLVMAGYRAIRSGGESRLIALPSAATLAFFLVVAVQHKVEANWPATAWIPLVILFAVGFERYAGQGLKYASLSIAAAAAFSFLLLMPPALLARLNKHTPLANGNGWSLLVKHTRQAGKTLPIVCTRYQDASVYSYYQPGRPAVPVLHKQTARQSQFDLWPISAIPSKFLLVSDGRLQPGLHTLYLGTQPVQVQIDTQRELAARLDDLQFRARILHEARLVPRDELGMQR